MDSDGPLPARRPHRCGGSPRQRLARGPEYDHALAASPALCRPFAVATGDLRKAAACLAGYTADCASGLARPGLTPSAAGPPPAWAARARLKVAEAKATAGRCLHNRLQCGYLP
jgi:hypothetical protein